MENQQNILLLTNNELLVKQLKEDKQNNIIHMTNAIETLDCYDLLKTDIDIVILDKNIDNIEILKNIQNEKPTIYIQPPLEGYNILNKLIEE